MILITGSTGGFGKAAISYLLKKGFPTVDFAAFARNKEKAAEFERKGIEIRIGNYNDYESLVTAFKGIDRLFFISGSEVGKRDQQHDNIIEAAKQQGIRHIIYTSFDRKDDNLNSPVSAITSTHIKTEQIIRQAGFTYTFLRNALYAEGVPGFIGKDAVEKGIFVPAGNGKVPYASRTEMAEAAANILIEGGHENMSFRTVNTINYSFADIAAIISGITGKNVKYLSPDAAEYSRVMSAAGMPAEAIAAMTRWFSGIEQGYFESTHSDMEMLLGRKPMSLEQVLRKMYI